MGPAALAVIQALGSMKEGGGGAAAVPAAPDVITITPTVTTSGRAGGGDFIVGGQSVLQSALPWLGLVILAFLLLRKS